MTPTLAREFAADARTCLFGTLSLWQGVDAALDPAYRRPVPALVAKTGARAGTSGSTQGDTKDSSPARKAPAKVTSSISAIRSGCRRVSR